MAAAEVVSSSYPAESTEEVFYEAIAEGDVRSEHRLSKIYG